MQSSAGDTVEDDGDGDEEPADKSREDAFPPCHTQPDKGRDLRPRTGVDEITEPVRGECPARPGLVRQGYRLHV